MDPVPALGLPPPQPHPGGLRGVQCVQPGQHGQHRAQLPTHTGQGVTASEEVFASHLYSVFVAEQCHSLPSDPAPWRRALCAPSVVAPVMSPEHRVQVVTRSGWSVSVNTWVAAPGDDVRRLEEALVRWQVSSDWSGQVT